MPKIVVIPDEGMDEDTKKHLRLRFEAEACNYCGGLHEYVCPRVKKIIYHPSDDRVVREVEFWPDDVWDHSRVIFPHDVILWMSCHRTRLRIRVISLI